MDFYIKNDIQFNNWFQNGEIPPKSIWRLLNEKDDEFQLVRVPEKGLQVIITISKDDFYLRFNKIDILDFIDSDDLEEFDLQPF